MGLRVASSCPCLGDGYTYDEACARKTCAHAKRPVIKRDDEGKVLERGSAMECWRRPCHCPDGALYRADLKARIKAQEERFAVAEAEGWR